MNFLEAVLLGIVEGVTEFLPISSTGHLMLASHVLGLEQTEFQKSFEIAIQLGAILSVVLLYWRQLLVRWEVAKRVLVAFLPTAALGLLLYRIVKMYLLASVGLVVATLFLGGLLLVLFEAFHQEKAEAKDDLAGISLRQALAIGLFQSVAMVPGVSRAAATIIGGLLLGLRRKTIVEFSFLLAVPTMAAATGLDLVKSASAFSLGQVHLLLAGFVMSFLVAIASIKFLLRFIQAHSFAAFGVYRVALAAVFWLLAMRS